ncbi:hypothetical protein [Mucilaginibacter sp.]|uniref:hypothetical protein n=1 Tax=Mucilaginibacter sp. TaxID=1882438 RepID=UPI00283F95CF|nr:hypothetical protein [Mucilaginibacter sp.]MDR3694672.1 hypothetical protein [Mucilaginibacter sp.]
MPLRESCYDPLFKTLINQNVLKWKPWVGEDYETLEANRLLIVGESHYQWDNDDNAEETVNKNNWTRLLIHGKGLWGKEDATNPIIRNTERALFSRAVVEREFRHKLWRSVSFYNFIQAPMDSLNHRPTAKQWEQGWDGFFKVVDILQPDYILFLGLEASNRTDFFSSALKNNDYKCTKGIGKDTRVGSAFKRTRGIIANGAGYEASISMIGHPSNFFSWKAWAGVIKQQMPGYIQWLKTPVQTSREQD